MSGIKLLTPEQVKSLQDYIDNITPITHRELLCYKQRRDQRVNYTIVEEIIKELLKQAHEKYEYGDDHWETTSSVLGALVWIVTESIKRDGESIWTPWRVGDDQ